MRLLRGVLALLLCCAVGVQPALAQFTVGRVAVPNVSAAGSAAASFNAGASIQPVQLTTLGVVPNISAVGSLTAPSVLAVPAAAVLPVSAVPVLSAAPALARPAAPAALTAAPSSKSGKISVTRHVAQIAVQARAAVRDLDRASGAQSREKADVQFAALTEGLRAAAADGIAPRVPPAAEGAAAPR
ncbi:MAG: hypothetical protein KGL74_07935, partial [Elusimicrobia bacterium]|nr:hypothetical protein [Elusimicrobiota bacterium]